MAEELEELARQLKAEKDRKDELKYTLKGVNERIAAISRRMLEIFDSRDITQIRYQDLGTFFVKGSSYPKCQDTDSFHEWLRAQGHESLIREVVHPSTLRGFVNDLLANGQPLPPGVTPGHLVREVQVKAG